MFFDVFPETCKRILTICPLIEPIASRCHVFFPTLGVHQVIPTYTWIAYSSIILGYAKANVVYPTLDFDISIYENTLYLTLDDLGIPEDKRSARTHFWRSLFYGGLRLKLDQHVTLILSRQVVQYVFCFFLQYIYIYIMYVICVRHLHFPRKRLFFPGYKWICKVHPSQVQHKGSLHLETGFNTYWICQNNGNTSKQAILMVTWLK